MRESAIVLAGAFLGFTVLILASPSAAQFNGVVTSSGTFHPDTGTTIHRSMTLESGLMRLGPPVTGQPYSGDLESENTQTLNNGTHIHQKREVSRTCRDSQGRTRIERLMFQSLRQSDAAAKDQAPRLIQIYDPVEGYEYTLDTEKHIAHRVAVQRLSENPVRKPQPDTPEARQARQALRDRLKARAKERLANTKRERIGTQTVEGVEAEGERVTMTTPVDAMGNDKPIVHVCEVWHAVELKTLLLSTCTDPRFGHMTLRLTNLDRSEPDAMLFMVPNDYTIVDDKGRFTVGFGDPEKANPE